MKLKQLTKAGEMSNIRRSKVRQAESTTVDTLKKSIEKLKREIHFWHGVEGVQWFMSKSDISPEALDVEFDAMREQAFLESDETHLITRKITALTQDYTAALSALLDEAQLK